MEHFSGHKVNDVRFVVLQCLGREGRATRQPIDRREMDLELRYQRGAMYRWVFVGFFIN